MLTGRSNGSRRLLQYQYQLNQMAGARVSQPVPLRLEDARKSGDAISLHAFESLPSSPGRLASPYFVDEMSHFDSFCPTFQTIAILFMDFLLSWAFCCHSVPFGGAEEFAPKTRWRAGFFFKALLACAL